MAETVASEHAAFTTVGAIALQGFRQSEARLGETACVIGLGLVGQLLVQILRAAGVNVVGLDPSVERCRLEAPPLEAKAEFHTVACSEADRLPTGQLREAGGPI